MPRPWAPGIQKQEGRTLKEYGWRPCELLRKLIYSAVCLPPPFYLFRHPRGPWSFLPLASCPWLCIRSSYPRRGALWVARQPAAALGKSRPPVILPRTGSWQSRRPSRGAERKLGGQTLEWSQHGREVPEPGNSLGVGGGEQEKTGTGEERLSSWGLSPRKTSFYSQIYGDNGCDSLFCCCMSFKRHREGRTQSPLMFQGA